MDVPKDLARLLEGRPDVESSEQAFPFLTVDEAGFPHVALLSRSEIDVPPDRSQLRVAIASAGTIANLRRTERAGLIAIDGTVAHYAKLRVVRTIEMANLLGCALTVEHHKRDSAGIPMEPITFATSAELARQERWDDSARVLAALADPSTQ